MATQDRQLLLVVQLALACSLVAALVPGCGAGKAPVPGTIEADPVQGPPEPLDVKPFIIPGELFRYRLSLRGIVGGEASLAVGEPGIIDGRAVVIIKSRTESVGVVAAIKKVRDEVTTWLDVGSGAPVYYYADVKFGRKEAIVETRFGEGNFNIDYRQSGIGERAITQRMPEGQSAYDAASVIAALRGWQPTPGGRAVFHAIAGKRLWRNVVTMTGRTQITTELGTFDALRVDGVATRMTRSLKTVRSKKPRHYSIWISDDDERKPLLVIGKTEYGDVRAELFEYNRPPSQVTLAPSRTR